MKLSMRGRNIGISDLLAEHVRERLALALRRFQGRIEHVEVVFTDLDGPRRGARQAACRVVVDLGAGRRTMVEARDRHFYASASTAARLIGRVVDLELFDARHARRDRRAAASAAQLLAPDAGGGR